MCEDRIDQVVYIKSSRDDVWNALTDPDLIMPACSQAWPAILSSLKTLLETGTALPEARFDR